MNPPFEFAHRFTLVELKRYLLIAHRRKMLFCRLYGIVLCAALLFLVHWDASVLASLLMDTSFVLLGLASLFLLILFIAFPKYLVFYPALWLGGKQYRQGVTRFVFGEESLCIHFSMLSDTPVTIPYRKIRRLLESDDALFIPHWRGDSYIMLPKSEFSTESLTDMRTFIEEKTAKKFTFVK